LQTYEISWTEDNSGDTHWARFVAKDFHDAILNAAQSIACRPEIRITDLARVLPKIRIMESFDV
jgi:hypothetical protein